LGGGGEGGRRKITKNDEKEINREGGAGGEPKLKEINEQGGQTKV